MSDLPAPIPDDDLSAALDGEAPADLVARIAQDPAASARSDALRDAATWISDAPVPPVDHDVVDGWVATALDTEVAPSIPSGRPLPPTWLVAAAITLLVAVGLTLVWTGRDGGDDVASSGDTSMSATDGTGDPGAEAGAPDDQFDNVGGAIDEGLASERTTEADTTVGSADPGTDLVDLGTFESSEDLRSALATSFPPSRTSEATSSSPEAAGLSTAAVSRCAEQLEVTLDLDESPLQTGVAVVDDVRLLVYEFAAASFTDGTPTTLVAAVDVETCTPSVLFVR